MRTHLEALETAIGYRFRDRKILCRALTHSSYVHEKALGNVEDKEVQPQDNEQLEFLGDSILGFLISEALLHRFPEYQEGRLSKLKAHLVSATYLHEVAVRLELGAYLHLGRGEELSGGRSKKTLLVNGLEALIAALYLDRGLEAARSFVTRCIIGEVGSELRGLEDAPDTLIDFKSALQELAQARRLPQPRYAIVKERGPEHAKTFTIEVRVGPAWISQGEGRSKKSAAQEAARDVLERLMGEAR